MEYSHSYLLFFAGFLLFLIVDEYGWILKTFYRPRAYAQNFAVLFPGQRSVSLLYFVQICQLPYLFHIGEPDYLFYANSFALLSFSSIMVEMYEEYFFLHTSFVRSRLLYYLPAWCLVVLIALGLVIPGMHEWVFSLGMKIAVFILFIVYFSFNLTIVYRLRKVLRQFDLEVYSNPDNFPARIAERVLWMSVLICVLLMIPFLFQSVWSKWLCDLILTGVCLWFTLMTLNPWRSDFKEEEKVTLQVQMGERERSFNISESRAHELASRMRHLLEEKRLFTEPNLTVDQLTMMLSINRNYMSEVIHYAGYKSFFDMINTYRVQYAAELLVQNKDMSIFDVAAASGFSSLSYMSRTFKSYMHATPSEYRKRSTQA